VGHPIHHPAGSRLRERSSTNQKSRSTNQTLQAQIKSSTNQKLQVQIKSIAALRDLCNRELRLFEFPGLELSSSA